MNNIYASKMQKHASQELAEGQKIISVKIGEAEAERKALLGIGTARQRSAIASGLEASLSGFADAVSTDQFSCDRGDALYIQMLMNYFDSLVSITNGSSRTPNLYLSADPKTVFELRESMDVGKLVSRGGEDSKARKKKPPPGSPL